ncbi:hypothetical protein ABOM_002907 [Aspergillus bombycis]|uniref:Uncharacterized protein n=1 Tax=Aspergillus bombycis TaxID=109264 RepID=A0A1F8A9R5_9EURO|nr:hypothetical protein ABOM_002907 [Aspergillus bombycis]OGM48048.1 hypothetical protein ABOM_002907 [Aspergillus bombycis]
MATISSDISLSAEPAPVAAACRPLAGLLAAYVVWTWSRMERLQVEAEAVQASLTTNEGTGNQWLVVLDLTKKAIEKPANHENGLRGIAYRFQWEGTVGIIKGIPGYSHEYPTQESSMTVNDQLAAMGIGRNDRSWGGRTTYSPTCNTGKEADQIFTPFNRRPSGGVVDWPTLAIETGASESYQRLQEDVRWWFKNSNGRWQLVPHPSNPDRALFKPITAASADNVPTRAAQPLVVTQRPYSAQEILVTPGTMGIPFEALYDRSRGPTETDVILTGNDVRDFARTSF